MKRRNAITWLAVLVLSVGAGTAAHAQYDFQFRFGSPGSGPGQFAFPMGVAVDAASRIIVADTFNDRVQIFDSAGNFVRSLGGFGSGPGQFNLPERVAVDGAGRIIVSDTGNDRVQIFDAGGSWLKTFGGFGTVAGKFDGPSGVAVDGANRLIVADFFNQRVQVFDADGNFLLSFGSRGSAPGQFSGPSGVAVDADGRIIVTDFNNDRVQVFDADGNFLWNFGSSGTGPGQLDGPSGVAVDAVGRILVSDMLNGRVQVFDGVGIVVGSFGSPGSLPGQFNHPSGLAVDAPCRALVADAFNHRIQIFASGGSAPPMTTATLFPEPASSGWSDGDGTVTLSAAATGCDSEVAEIVFSLSGAQSGDGVVPGDTATFPIGAEGVTTVTYFARDHAGNEETPKTLTVRIDRTPPAIACSVTPAPNPNGWHNADATVIFTASDAVSGVVSMPDPVTVVTEGADQAITRTVSDRAGNTASVTCRVSLDKTPPTVSFGVPSPPPNEAGWNNTNVAIPFSVADNLSGVALVSQTSPLVLSAEGTNLTGTVTVIDLAGNRATFTSPSANIDRTPPAVTCSVSPTTLWPPNHQLVGVVASVTVMDALSGPGGFLLTGAASNEPDSGQGGGDEPGDIQGFAVGTADTDGLLRAERWSGGSGRVYTLTYTGRDLAGNTATCSPTIGVPHDQGR
jgi:hypothetical protein